MANVTFIVGNEKSALHRVSTEGCGLGLCFVLCGIVVRVLILGAVIFFLQRVPAERLVELPKLEAVADAVAKLIRITGDLEIILQIETRI